MKAFVLLATLVTVGLAGPVAVVGDSEGETVAGTVAGVAADKRSFVGTYVPAGEEGETPEKRAYFNGIYIGPSAEGETAEEKRSFVGTYVPAGEEGDTPEKRSNFNGIYIGPSVEGETAEKH